MTNYEIVLIIEELDNQGRFLLEENTKHHGSTTTKQHSIQVAKMSCKIAEHLPLHIKKRIDMNSLLWGALLHDYFLYNWHTDKHSGLHGFTHSKTSLRNAKMDFDINHIIEDIIIKHMFPLTIIPPVTREAWIVCLADKICAIEEVTAYLWSKFCFKKSVVL